MAPVSVSQIKELRERSGASIIDCKNALTKANGDMDAAADILRKSGKAGAARETSNVASRGIVQTYIQGDHGVILEISCQSDFVAQFSGFQDFVHTAVIAAAEDRTTDVEALKAKFEEKRAALSAALDETITIRRLGVLKGAQLGTYVHVDRIGVLLSATGNGAQVLKQVAQHIAGFKPIYLNPEQIPEDWFACERQIQMKIATESGKPKDVAGKWVQDRIGKLQANMCLTTQPFLLDMDKTVDQVLKENGTNIPGLFGGFR